MPYAFNDDKSKYEMFVVLEGSISVAANNSNYRDYGQSELTALGIDKPENYMVVSAMVFSSTTGNTGNPNMPICWSPANDNFYVLIYSSGHALGPEIEVNINNTSPNNLIYQYRVVLMKYPDAA